MKWDSALSTCDKDPVWSVLCCQDDDEKKKEKEKKEEPRGKSGERGRRFPLRHRN